MAADWIKLRTDLQSHPKIVRILSATGTDKFRVVGGLHAVWSVFDTHSVDGVLKGYTPEIMDHIIGWDGFSRAMESVGWLSFDGLETLSLPEFDTHNGQSAKRRAEDQKRKRTSRERPESVRKMSANDSDKKRTREEKRREEKEQDQKPSSSATADDQPAPERHDLKTRLAAVASEAIETFNASPLVKANGGMLASISAKVGREKRQAQVSRCLRTARQICEEAYGSPLITAAFWSDYWGEIARDDFHAGRMAGGKGHENWKPDFEFLTREATMLKVYDRTAGKVAP